MSKMIALGETGEKLLDLITEKIEEYRRKNGPYIKAFEERIIEKQVKGK